MRYELAHRGFCQAPTLPNEQARELLIGERRRLAESTVRKLVPHRFSYYEDDFAR